MYGVIKWYRPKNVIYYQAIQGLWFGAVAVLAMMMPFEYHTGAFYDGRSVVITLAGLWGGGLPVIISAVMAGVYRAYMGGVGIWAGITKSKSSNIIDKYFIFNLFTK